MRSISRKRRGESSTGKRIAAVERTRRVFAASERGCPGHTSEGEGISSHDIDVRFVRYFGLELRNQESIC